VAARRRASGRGKREATRQEILAAAWDAAHENSLAGLTLRDIATRVGMRQPSLHSHFASKNAIYDGMFEQAWRTFLDYARAVKRQGPAGRAEQHHQLRREGDRHAGARERPRSARP
jgi:AcrR family transcriptional regulator